MNNLLKAISAILILTISLACLIASYIALTGYLPSDFDEEKSVLIKPGMSSVSISKLLKNHGIIESEFMFIIYAKIVAKERKLIAGEYLFKPKSSIKQIIEIISKGESILRKIIIPEGLTSYQIVDMLNNETRLVGEITNIPDEGTLFPNTYYFKYGDLRTKLINHMKLNMIETLTELQLNYRLPSGIKTINEILTLASIIEKEAGNNDEKNLISSVFHNRLKKKMRLQADPTVIYAITNGKSNLGRKLSRNDLKIDSPYNTYKKYGLPPGPISCPGFESLHAAFVPSDTNYLYFVAGNNSGHNFSTNLRDHINHVNNYKKKSNKPSDSKFQIK